MYEPDNFSGLFQLDDHELKLVQNKKPSHNRLAFSVMLKYFQLEKRYPKSITDIDLSLLTSLASQLGTSANAIKYFDWESRTAKRFRLNVREFLGYREANTSDQEKLITWLKQEHLNSVPSLVSTIEYAYEYFKLNRIEPFSHKKIERYVRSAQRQFEDEFFKAIYNLLSKEAISAMNELLLEEQNLEKQDSTNNSKQSGSIKLVDLKKGIPGAKLKHVEFEILKISSVKALTIPEEFLSSYPTRLIKKYYRRVMAETPSSLSDKQPVTRYALLFLFLYYRSQRMHDSLADMLIKLIHKIRTSSETSINKKILTEVKRVNGKFDILYQLADASSAHPDGVIENIIYPIVSRDTLKELMVDLKHRGKWYQNEVQTKMQSLYTYGNRKLLIKLLGSFQFGSHLEQGKNLISAIAFIRKHQDLKNPYYENTSEVLIDKVVPTKWRHFVVQEDKANQDNIKVNRRHYELAVLEELKKQLHWVN